MAQIEIRRETTVTIKLTEIEAIYLRQMASYEHDVECVGFTKFRNEIINHLNVGGPAPCSFSDNE